MSIENGIDTLHYVILETLEDPKWKTRIRDVMQDTAIDHPLEQIPSIQTIGRRVDELADQGYITSCILSPDNVDRDLIISYRLTEDGRQVMSEKRDEILQEVAHTTSNKACAQERSVSKPALVKMIAEQFDLDDDGKNRITEQYSEDELLSLLTLHYAQENADTFATHDRCHTHSGETNENFQHLVQ